MTRAAERQSRTIAYVPPSRARRRAFTMIEILIVVTILGIIAAIVVPQFSNASQVARENTLKDDLRYLRTQIVVFTAEHEDTPPGYPGGNTSGVPTAAAFVDQMTRYSSVQCATSDSPSETYEFGPYLSEMPSNPVNGKSSILVVGNGVAMPAPDGTTGWIYKPQTQELLANLTGNDSKGTAYAEY